MHRVGFGHDSHRFSSDPSRALVLGGLAIPDHAGLEGDSDADVVLHALCRALEQAIGLDAFSDYATDMSKRGINDSRAYIGVAVAHVTEAGFRINNVGITIEAARPRIDPVRREMKRSIAGLLGIAEGAVGLNASTGDGLTSFGRGEGIQAFVIVSVETR